MKTDWEGMLTQREWGDITGALRLSPGQSSFLWHALHDPRDVAIAERMSVSLHGAHAHRMAVFRKLGVDCMPAAIARVFAAYVILRSGTTIDPGGPL